MGIIPKTKVRNLKQRVLTGTIPNTKVRNFRNEFERGRFRKRRLGINKTNFKGNDPENEGWEFEILVLRGGDFENEA